METNNNSVIYKGLMAIGAILLIGVIGKFLKWAVNYASGANSRASGRQRVVVPTLLQTRTVATPIDGNQISKSMRQSIRLATSDSVVTILKSKQITDEVVTFDFSEKITIDFLALNELFERSTYRVEGQIMGIEEGLFVISGDDRKAGLHSFKDLFAQYPMLTAYENVKNIKSRKECLESFMAFVKDLNRNKNVEAEWMKETLKLSLRKFVKSKYDIKIPDNVTIEK